jgi:hypothetical protein
MIIDSLGQLGLTLLVNETCQGKGTTAMRTLLPLVLGAVLIALGAVFVLAPSGSAVPTAPTVHDGTAVYPQITASPMGGGNGGCC